jgi:acetate kinase
VIAGCGWLGADLAAGDSGDGERKISSANAAVEVWVIPTDEERMIARHTHAVLTG